MIIGPELRKWCHLSLIFVSGLAKYPKYIIHMYVITFDRIGLEI